MYLVDTSVWIHALRPSGHPVIQSQLRPLLVNGETAITEWILLELMTGLTKGEQPESFLRWFLPVARLSFQSEWWDKAWHHAGRLASTVFLPRPRIVSLRRLHWNIGLR